MEAYEKIDYSLDYVADVFDPRSSELADTFALHGRCLMVVDENVFALHGDRARAYFAHHGIDLTVVEVRIAETAKTLRTVEQIVDAFADFGLMRKEQVLVVGGGLTTDVAGFACAAYKRSTGYVRIPTTLIGLIDASVSIKVGANHGPHKNRLGAYHASSKVFLDFSMLRTLPIDQVRNGIAEIIKIATVSDLGIFERLEKYGEELLASAFGHAEGAEHLREVSGSITYDAIRTMLELEVPNLHELDLDRVIAFGHTWSPTLELTPQPHYFHGHAISVDMAFSATLAEQRGYLTTADRDRSSASSAGWGCRSTARGSPPSCWRRRPPRSSPPVTACCARPCRGRSAPATSSTTSPSTSWSPCWPSTGGSARSCRAVAPGSTPSSPPRSRVVEVPAPAGAPGAAVPGRAALRTRPGRGRRRRGPRCRLAPARCAGRPGR